MGVYIKGMGMPKDKAVAVVIHPDGTAYTAEMFAGVCTEYLSDCTAIPVPPHGGLVDVDALLAQHYGRFGAIDEVAREAIKNAPIIIPAEEDET